MSLPQPVPPSWKDIGKSSNDLLTKDFPSTVSLEVKTKTPSGVVFKVFGCQDPKSPNINGDIETKYSNPAQGIVFTKTWTTSNMIKAQCELDNYLAKGLKLDFCTTIVPHDTSTTGLFNFAYKQSGVHTRGVLELFKGPTFTADTVFGRDGFLFGTQAAYNVTEGKVTRYAAALGYSAPEYAVTLHGLNNLNTFAASYYHRVSPDVEAGAKAIFDPKVNPSGVTLEVGTKAYLDSAAFVKAKINSCGILGLGYTQTLRPGVKVSCGLTLDTQRLNQIAPTSPAHKAGISLTFDA